MHGATEVWNISKIDYMGVWNEPPVCTPRKSSKQSLTRILRSPFWISLCAVDRTELQVSYIPPLWLIQLRRALDDGGYNSTQLIAPDASSTGSQVLKLLEDMGNSTALADAVDVIGTHGYWDAPPTTYTKLIDRYPKNTKRAWVSESWHQMGNYYRVLCCILL